MARRSSGRLFFTVRRMARVGWAGALAACVLCLAVRGYAETLRGSVVFVPDGDTLVLDSGDVVRIQGVDTPEMGRDGAPDQYFAREAREELVALVLGQDVAVTTLGGAARDRYGRVLGSVALADGQDVATLLVQGGCAFCYPHDDQPASLTGPLLAAQRRAMEAGAGFWPRVLALDAGGGQWIGNRRSRRFHGPGSPQGRAVAAANRVVFSCLRAAFWEGFAPARTSTPWPAARRQGRATMHD
ncbi:MAG: thermonuclease family protein [Desulfovibrionaceae bacterium]